jgi:very-short-patch-repair endonuclease
MAAVLACGPGALLSHRSAAALWALRATAATRVDVTVQAGNRSRRPGIAVHLTGHLPPEESAGLDGIPVTSVARTLLDLAGVLPAAQLRLAMEEAERLELLDARAVEQACDHGRGRRGTRQLRSLIAGHLESPPPTRSTLERQFHELCRNANLSLPSLNVRVAGFEVDALWRDERLVVELDGFEFHRGRAAFERDRQRDAALQMAGYRVLRVTHRRLQYEPTRVVEAVRALLDYHD